MFASAVRFFLTHTENGFLDHLSSFLRFDLFDLCSCRQIVPFKHHLTVSLILLMLLYFSSHLPAHLFYFFIRQTQVKAMSSSLLWSLMSFLVMSKAHWKTLSCRDSFANTFSLSRKEFFFSPLPYPSMQCVVCSRLCHKKEQSRNQIKEDAVKDWSIFHVGQRSLPWSWNRMSRNVFSSFRSTFTV